MITDSFRKMYHDKEHPKKSDNRNKEVFKKDISVNILSLQLFLSFVKNFFLFLKKFHQKLKLTIFAKRL